MVSVNCVARQFVFTFDEWFLSVGLTYADLRVSALVMCFLSTTAAPHPSHTVNSTKFYIHF